MQEVTEMLDTGSAAAPTVSPNAAALSATLMSRTHRANSILCSWRAGRSLCWREIIRFLRQRNRVVGAVGQPIMFWLLFSAGMNQTFQVPGQRFSQYFVPGTVALILLFTAIFATISIIEDRQEGFLQSVLVAPVARWGIVLGKVLGGTTLAVGQGSFFLALAILFGMRPTLLSGAATFALMTLLAFGLTSLGFCLAWRLDSTQGFHAIMNLLLMPMWLLSGAFFPVPAHTVSASWSEHGLHWIMRVNPVTYAVAGLRQLMTPELVATSSGTASGLWLPSLTYCWIITAAFAVITFVAAVRMARRPSQGDLR